MKLCDFAISILFGSSLAEKLVSATTFEPSETKALTKPPPAPGRIASLRLHPRGVSQKVKFPSIKDLEDPVQRGTLLHFFANHELLAMELMALALLRFPQAPAGFLHGIAQTICEEQNHLRLYLERMREFGVEFGSVPVNRFFWDCIADMQTPMDYVTRMSMTLEQANLDFSLYYRNIFAALGDAPTTAILDRVYQEEIGHVKHGVIWFDRWRAQGTSQWEEYLARMGPPLAASRAKGIGFDRDGRLRAGLSEAFIDELAVYKHSKGRPPIVFLFNPACEEEIAQPTAAYRANRAVTQITDDLATLMLFAAAGDDVVLCKQKPSHAFLLELEAAGFSIPQLITLDAAGSLRGRLVSHVEPWGQSPAIQRQMATLALQTSQPRRYLDDFSLFGKDWSARLASKLKLTQPESMIVDKCSAAIAVIQRHFSESSKPLVMKAPFGASGRHMQRILAPGLLPQQRQWLEKILQTQGKLIIEQWLDKVLDLSIQLNVNNGEKSVLGLTRFLTNARGQYIGHRLGRKFDDLKPEFLRMFYGQAFQEKLLAIGAEVGSHLAAAGYQGVAGVDSLVYLVDDQLHLKPIVEINPRYSMGRIAFEIDRRIHHAVPALWLHLSHQQVQAVGFADFQELVMAYRARYPLRQKNHLMEAGVLPTNDPLYAKQVLSLLFIGEAAVTDAEKFLI